MKTLTLWEAYQKTVALHDYCHTILQYHSNAAIKSGTFHVFAAEEQKRHRQLVKLHDAIEKRLKGENGDD